MAEWRVVNRLPQLALVIVALILMLRTERFFTPSTLTSILTQASIFGVLALGQAFVLLGGIRSLARGDAGSDRGGHGPPGPAWRSPGRGRDGRPGEWRLARLDQRRDGRRGPDQSLS